MDSYIESLFQELLSGVPLGQWQSFLKKFK